MSHWDIMKLSSTWCVLDPERVCKELNELFSNILYKRNISWYTTTTTTTTTEKYDVLNDFKNGYKPILD